MHVRADEAALLCGGCGYDLREIPSDRCPECGRRFDRNFLIADLIPWEQRKYIGRWRAFWRTAWIATARPAQLLTYADRPMELAAARSFALLAMSLTVTATWAVALTGYREVSHFYDQFHSPPAGELLRVFVINPAALLVTVTAISLTVPATVLISLGYLHDRQAGLERQNRAIAIGWYLSGPLAWMAAAMFGLAGLILSRWWEQYQQDASKGVVLAALLALVALLFIWRRRRTFRQSQLILLWGVALILALSVLLPSLFVRRFLADAVVYFVANRLIAIVVAAALIFLVLWWFDTLRAMRSLTGCRWPRIALACVTLPLTWLVLAVVLLLTAHAIFFMATMLATW